MAKKNKPFNFEDALHDLEKIVEQMETGELTMDASLKNFETGIKLTRACQKALKEAEQKVSILVEKNGVTEIKPFEENQDV